MSRRPVFVLLLAVAIGVSVAAPSMRADTGKTLKHPPSLLWKSYPLKQRATAQARAKARAAAHLTSRTRKASAQTQSSKTSSSSLLLLVTMMLAAMVAAGMIVLSRLRPVRIGLPFSRRRRLPPRPTTTVQSASGEELLDALRRWTPPGSDELPEAVVFKPALPAPSPVLESTETLPRPKPQPKAPEEPKRSQEAKPAARQDMPTPRPAARPTREVMRRPSHRQGTSVARCEIRLWRGYVKCQLYAVLEGYEERAIASSKYFRLRDDAMSSPQGQQALTALLATLEARGWTVVGVGPIWYWHRLERFE
jgi:hypothetical protein